MTHEPLEEPFPDVTVDTFRDTFHVDQYPENLPRITPQELRIIGRTVSFTAESSVGGLQKSFLFKGLVTFITKDTVTLIDALRFDSTDELQRSLQNPDEEMQKFPLSLHRFPFRHSPLLESNDVAEADPSTASASSCIPPTGTFGRIPYSTFYRRKIRNVKFETDIPIKVPSRTLFMDAGADPDWYFHDLQKVKTFVRRYLIHTAQNNNTQHLSLVAFLAARLQWTPVDTEMLKEMCVEEVRRLVEVDKEIAARQQQLQQNQGNRRRVGGDGDGGGANVIQGVIGNRFTDLRRSSIASRTAYSAVFHFIVAVAVLLYVASIFTTIEKSVVLTFVKDTITYDALAGASLLISGICTGVHGFRMTTYSSWLHVSVRLFFSLLTGALVAYTIYSCSLEMISFKQPGGSSLATFFEKLVISAPSEICTYASKNICSGFKSNCKGKSGTSECPASCSLSYVEPCSVSLETKIKSSLLPMLVLQVISAISVLIDLGLLYLYRKSTMIRQT